MPIRCRYEHDGQGILLSQIKSLADALKVRNYLVEKGIGAAVIDPVGPKDFRVFVEGIPLNSFIDLITGSDIELVV